MSADQDREGIMAWFLSHSVLYMYPAKIHFRGFDTLGITELGTEGQKSTLVKLTI